MRLVHSQDFSKFHESKVRKDLTVNSVGHLLF